MFGRPKATIAIRAGGNLPSARSDIFAFTTEQLTVSKGDFAGASFSVDLGVRLMERLDLQFGGGLMLRAVGSEFRDWVGTDDLPITQTTTFRRVPLTAGLRYHLTPPGRSVSRLAWIPARFTPYVGAGGGTMYYHFKQVGEFVDFESLDVFRESLSSSAWTPMMYANAGIDYSLSTQIGLVTEVRYDQARAPMGSDFQGFDRIDLSGLSATVGFNIRF